MLKTDNHIKNARHILLMCFVWFALSPCIVKNVLFSAANMEYTQPLNKTKTPANSCQYAQNDIQQVSVAKRTNSNKPIKPVNVSANRYYIAHSAKIPGNYSGTFPDNGPPKYILYKQLKLDLA